jgi:hypothetical protein
MFGDNKQIRDVADVAARIMAGLPPLQEKLHPNQQKIDVVDDEKRLMVKISQSFVQAKNLM